MKYPLGSRVKVSVASTTQIPNNPLQKLNGRVYTVKDVQLKYQTRAPHWIYQLYGAESDMGVPYTFMEEDLIAADE